MPSSLGTCRRSGWGVALAVLLAACTTLDPTDTRGPPSSSPGDATPGETDAASTHPTPDLSQRPMVWFAPLPPDLPIVEGREFTGSDDFYELFDPDADWGVAAPHVHVFKLYAGWTPQYITNQELRAVVDDVRRRGMALAIEAGPLTARECGAGIEGFAGIDEARGFVAQLRSIGATLDLLAFDEPLYHARFADAPDACHWDAARVASEVAEYVGVVRTAFPSVRIGDIEPLIPPMNAAIIDEWLAAYQAAVGEPLAFLHMDIPWWREGWEQVALEVEEVGNQRDIETGIIYIGENTASSDREWVESAGERVRKYELIAGGQPDHVVFQSWVDHPDFVLPDGDPTTFTGFIAAYFADRSALGFDRSGVGANLALDAGLSASGEAEQPVRFATDGEHNTWWGAGAFAPAWIQLELPAERSIVEVRLLTGQGELVGRTVHRVLGRGPGTGDAWAVLATLDGVTSDLQWLSWAPSEPLTGIASIRIETTSSPSWIAWREVQVLAGN